MNDRPELRTVSSAELALYASVPISFYVHSRLLLVSIDVGLGGLSLVEETVASPYLKDYDNIEKPTEWPALFDTSKWLFVVAYMGDMVVGAVTVAWDTPDIHLLRGQRDLACLWDIRVHPDWRGQGIGTTLLQRAAAWSRSKGCRLLQIETQNINVPACHFYQRQGCTLGTIDRYGYLGTPVGDEVLLLWYLSLI
ncbi:MAG: GNAT family N-acetyltransferase [Anaerolineae bacterium]